LQSKRQWLSLADALAVHEAQIATHGGSEGLRDRGLLESALDRPRNSDAYGDPPPDVPQLAALYAIGIVRNHPFVDGNKRVGLVALELFLVLNSYRLAADDAECVVHILGLAAGDLSDEEFIAWVCDSAKPR